MCGIAGFSGTFEPGLLQSMNQLIAHRGPDDAGLWHDHDSRIGLAHHRLSIIDTSSAGHQPMWDATNTVIIVFNGEIYNYRGLRKELVDKGYLFKNHTDTEVLLNLYLCEGVAMLSRLNGIFAFALWDKRTGSLFAARDGLGVKPFYYAETSEGFIFASEIKAIVQEKSVVRDVNFAAIHYSLSYLWCPSPHTMLKSIKKLLPGHALLVKDGAIKKYWRYYEEPFSSSTGNLPEDLAIEKTRELLENAVKRQLVADVPVGALLSGGLDSSAIAYYAQKNMHSQKLQCFTIGFKDRLFQQEGFADDLPYAQKVAKDLNVDLHTVYVGPEMAGQLERMIYHLDEPQADPAPLNLLFICQLAREHGIKVLLSGAGGDDIFSGYRRHAALTFEKYWSWLPQRMRRRMSGFATFYGQKSPLSRRFYRAFNYAHLNGDERTAAYFRWTTPEVLRTLYSKDLKNEFVRKDPGDPLFDTLRNLPALVEPLNRMLLLEERYFLADHNLNYTDKMSMATGVEVRVPYLDPDLVRFAHNLPVRFKQRGAMGKWILKKAMASHLTKDIIYRPKTGFGAPIRHWLRNQLRPLVDEALSPSSLKIRGLFDPTGVGNLLSMNNAGSLDSAYTILSLLCIELWCRIFIDNKGNL